MRNIYKNEKYEKGKILRVYDIEAINIIDIYSKSIIQYYITLYCINMDTSHAKPVKKDKSPTIPSSNNLIRPASAPSPSSAYRSR